MNSISSGLPLFFKKTNMKQVLGVILICCNITLFAQKISFPLKASADKKYLVDQNNHPFFLNGCSVWNLPYAVNLAEAKALLEKLKQKKFNTVLLKLTPETKHFDIGPDDRVYDDNAFYNLDINQPNEHYFKHVDSLLSLCNEMNMAVMVAPLYLGCCGDGWLEVIEQYKDAETKCKQYGEWIANRYKHLPNLIWVSGGDHNPIAAEIAFAKAIASVDTTHLHTFHAHPGKSSGERFKGEAWHTLSAAYTYFPALAMNTEWMYKHVYAMMYEEKLYKYHMPCILIESAYEKERYTTAQTIRRQVYWALLGGASGQVYGHRDTYPVNKKVMTALDDPGAESMGIFKKFTETIPWYKMEGDWPHTLFLSGRGNFNPTEYPGGEDYAAAAFTEDSTLAILYMPTYRQVGVNMSRFKSSVTAQWFDPSSGEYKNVTGNFANKGIRHFTPTSFNNARGYNDWVLVLKAGK